MNNPNFPSRGGGYHPYRGRGRGRGNRGYQRGNPNYHSQTNHGTPYNHGDMKTGLFKPSFLEDPWKDLIAKKSLPGNTLETTGLGSVGEGTAASAGEQRISAKSDEGEIILPDDDDD